MIRRPPIGSRHARGLRDAIAACLTVLSFIATGPANASAEPAVIPVPAPAWSRPSAASRPAVDYSKYQERWVTEPKKQDSRLAHKTYRSAAMSADVGYQVYLPAGYADPANAGRRYPTIYWLHGLNQSESSDWFPLDTLDRAVSGGAVPPVIVVFASGGGRSFYCDAPERNVLPETTILKELIPHVDTSYRTVAAREGRALQGVSMGGFGALRLAMTHPELFSSVVGYMPSLRHPDDLAKTYPDVLARMFGGDRERFWSQHPLTLARRKADALRADLPIAFYSGTTDPLHSGAVEFDALLTELKIPHAYAEVPGVAHDLTKLVAGANGTPGVGDRGLRFAAEHFRIDPAE